MEESYFNALLQSILMRLGHAENLGQLAHLPFSKTADLYIGGAPGKESASVYCAHFDAHDDLSYDQSYLWNLGLLPHRCSGCEELKYNGSFYELGVYMEGPE